jgi:hypothetical protein
MSAVLTQGRPKMQKIRSSVDAMLVSLLLKPMLRRSVARWRRQARQAAETTVVMPAQAWLGGVLAMQSGSGGPAHLPGPEDPGDLARSDASRTVLIIGLVAGLAAILSAVVIAAIWRRRRAASRAQRSAQKERVAIPIEVPEETPVASADLAGVRDPSH